MVRPDPERWVHLFGAHPTLAAFLDREVRESLMGPVNRKRLRGLVAMIKPRPSHSNIKAEVRALVLVATCCARFVAIPPEAIPIIARLLPEGVEPEAVDLDSSSSAEAFALTIIEQGPKVAARRAAVALLAWHARAGLFPLMVTVNAFGVAFGLIDPATGEPTRQALGQALGTKTPERFIAAAIRDGRARATRKRRAPETEHRRLMDGRPLGKTDYQGFRSLRDARALPGYVEIEFDEFVRQTADLRAREESRYRVLNFRELFQRTAGPHAHLGRRSLVEAEGGSTVDGSPAAPPALPEADSAAVVSRLSEGQALRAAQAAAGLSSVAVPRRPDTKSLPYSSPIRARAS